VHGGLDSRLVCVLDSFRYSLYMGGVPTGHVLRHLVVMGASASVDQPSVVLPLVGLGLFLAILALVIAFVPEPWKARLRGLATLLAVSGACWLVVRLVRSSRDDWSWAHAVAATVVLVALVLAAAEWSALLFRLAAVAVLAATAVVTAQAGHVQLVHEANPDARIQATRLDSALARTMATYSKAKDTETEKVKSAKEAAVGEIKKFCNTADGAIAGTPESSDACIRSTDTNGESQSLSELRTEQAKAELSVAQLRLVVAQELEVGIAAAQRMVSSAQQQISLASNEQSISLQEAIAAGGRGLAAKSPLSTNAVPVAPDILGWILLLIGAVYAYRMLEVLNSHRDTGPITVEDVTGDLGDAKSEQVTSHLRYAVLKNLPEPGTVPGASSSNPLTDLLGADPIKNPILVAAITFVRLVGFPPRGYLVRASLATRTDIEGSGKSVDQHTAHIRVHDARTKRSVWTTACTATTRADALERGGFAAAAWILQRARSVPPWLQFSAEAAEALNAYERTRLTTDDVTLKELDRAVRRDPTSGVALVQLGYAYDLAGERIEALECYERTVGLFPEYRIARYRAAIGWSALHDISGSLDNAVKQRLSLLVGSADRIRIDETKPKRTKARRIGPVPTRTRAQINRSLGETNQTTASTVAPRTTSRTTGQSDTLREDLVANAIYRFKEVGDSNQLKWLFDLTWRSLSVYERPALPRLGQLRWTHRTLRASSLPTRVRDLELRSQKGEKPKGLKKLTKKAEERGAPWQLRYNLACAYSVYFDYNRNSKEDCEKAIKLLHDALLHPEAKQLTRKWLANDPDLKALGSQPQFDTLLRWAADERTEEP
jgi:tetratricopeptide (TPR) repeat protein